MKPDTLLELMTDAEPVFGSAQQGIWVDEAENDPKENLICAVGKKRFAFTIFILLFFGALFLAVCNPTGSEAGWPQSALSIGLSLFVLAVSAVAIYYSISESSEFTRDLEELLEGLHVSFKKYLSCSITEINDLMEIALMKKARSVVASQRMFQHDSEESDRDMDALERFWNLGNKFGFVRKGLGEYLRIAEGENPAKPTTILPLQKPILEVKVETSLTPASSPWGK